MESPFKLNHHRGENLIISSSIDFVIFLIDCIKIGTGSSLIGGMGGIGRRMGLITAIDLRN
jgi:hypothetical protein